MKAQDATPISIGDHRQGFDTGPFVVFAGAVRQKIVQEGLATIEPFSLPSWWEDDKSIIANYMILK